MSSATSIKNVRLEPAATTEGRTGTTTEDAGFRPWHFFVLASLIAATAAVVISRQSRPEHLVLISLTIAAAGLAAAGLYRMLAPLAASDASVLSEPLSTRARAVLEREKTLVLRSIKELEFDRAMGKLSAKDFDEMAGRLRSRAMSLMRELDQGEAGYRALIERDLAARLAHQKSAARVPPADATARPQMIQADPDTPPQEPVAVTGASRVCSSCQTANDHDAAFCKRCGVRL